MQKSAKPSPTRSIPPVQKPGIAQSRALGNADSIQSLQRQLDATSSTGKQLRIAAKILELQRAH